MHYPLIINKLGDRDTSIWARSLNLKSPINRFRVSMQGKQVRRWRKARAYGAQLKQCGPITSKSMFQYTNQDIRLLQPDFHMKGQSFALCRDPFSLAIGPQARTARRLWRRGIWEYARFSDTLNLYLDGYQTSKEPKIVNLWRQGNIALI